MVLIRYFEKHFILANLLSFASLKIARFLAYFGGSRLLLFYMGSDLFLFLELMIIESGLTSYIYCW